LEIKKEVVAILSSNILIKDKKILEFRLAEPFDSVIKDIENSKHQKKGKPGFELAKFVSSKTKTASSREAVPSMHGRQDSNLK
jgi:hypothetical protein